MEASSAGERKILQGNNGSTLFSGELNCVGLEGRRCVCVFFFSSYFFICFAYGVKTETPPCSLYMIRCAN